MANPKVVEQMIRDGEARLLQVEANLAAERELVPVDTRGFRIEIDNAAGRAALVLTLAAIAEHVEALLDQQAQALAALQAQIDQL